MSLALEDTVAHLVVAEGAGHQRAAPRTTRTTSRSTWLAWTTLIALVFAAWAAGIGHRAIVNPGGWPLTARFLRAATQPELSSTFVSKTIRASATTIAYAVLATAVSIVIGVAGGIVLSRRTLSRRIRRDRPHVGFRVARLVAAVPRGIHEAVWALLLLSVIGRDPLVAILAIGIPYGAITAKVYADLIDETSARQHRTLRAGGANRLQALLYATLPATAGDLIGYAFYRFECSIRAAVVLGMVGVGGLGFQLSQSFQGLAYGEMWTSIYALIILGALAEWWSARVRRGRDATRRHSLMAGVVFVVVAWWYLRPGLGALWSVRTRTRLVRWGRESLPPQLPRHGANELWHAIVVTVHMSFLAIAIAVALAAPLALIGARVGTGHGVAQRAVGLLARTLALFSRSIPPTVWALLALFVFFPGVVPGALALGVYTAGVLVRLFAEALEHADDRPRATLVAAGAGRLSAFAYGTVPSLAPRWATYSLYRWEVAARDAAVVGVVGVAGLGRLLAEQTAGFAYPRMTATIIALIVVTVFVDLVSSVVRNTLR